jgi:ion channel
MKLPATNIKFNFPAITAVILLLLFLPAYFSEPIKSKLIEPLLYTIFVIVSINFIRDVKQFKMVAYIIGIITFLATWVDALIIEKETRIVLLILYFVFFLIVAIELYIKIYKIKKVSAPVIIGAFCGYLFLGVLGSFVVTFIELIIPHSYTFDFSSQPGSIMYYTFMTLTTIGYGDIAPVSIPARNTAMVIGLAGQFYLTFVVAMIIGKYLQNKN